MLYSVNNPKILLDCILPFVNFTQDEVSMDLGPASKDMEKFLEARFSQTWEIIGVELQMQTLTNYYCQTILQKVLVREETYLI